MEIIDQSKFFDQPKYEEIYEQLKDALKATEVDEYPYDWEREDW